MPASRQVHRILTREEAWRAVMGRNPSEAVRAFVRDRGLPDTIDAVTVAGELTVAAFSTPTVPYYAGFVKPQPPYHTIVDMVTQFEDAFNQHRSPSDV